MKKAVFLLLVLALTLSACGGDVSEVEVLEWESSEIYSDDDIEEAMYVVEQYFKKNFNGCKLTELSYKDSAAVFDDWAEQYDAYEAIVIYSTFEVDDSGADPSLEPGFTYRNWKWILVRSRFGNWKHVDHGYG